ncbi:MAG: hypothetical protein ACE5MH_00065 [Terriglobia bacterium]
MSEERETPNCQHLRRVLGGVLEGEAEPEALAHLNACPRCRLLVEELSTIAHTATRLPLYGPSPGLWQRIRRAAEAEGLLEASWLGPLSRRFGLFQPVPLTPAFSAALVVLLVAAVVLVGYPGLEVGPAREELPNWEVKVARSELALAPNYGERYALHLNRIEASMREQVAPADTQLTHIAEANLETLDRFINQCQLRLTNYPEDEFTRDELNLLYQQKTTLLQAMLDPDWQTSLR